MPAETEASAGVAESVKSLKKMLSVTFAVWEPSVPVTLMFSGLEVVAVSPLTVTVLLWPAVTVLGLNAHVAPDEQVSVIVSKKVLGAEAVTVNVSVAVPIWMTLERVLAESENNAFPLPESATDCAPTAALSEMVTVPDRAPLPVGVKEMLIAHPSPTLRMPGRVPQVLVSAKSPVIVMELSVSEALPVFVRCTTSVGLVVPMASDGKVKLVGVMVRNPAEDATPFPVTVIRCGLPVALSEMVI